MIGIEKMADDKVSTALTNSLDGLTANAAIFPRLPIGLPTYKGGIDDFKAARPAADDGSKKAISLKNKLKARAVKMYVELAHHVESNCNEDMATFLLSGFQPLPNTKAAAQPLDPPTNVSAVPGPLLGQMKIQCDSAPRAMAHEVQYGAIPAPGTMPTTLLTAPMPSKRGVIITGLTPGVTYLFQVRALGKLGFSNFSDPVTRIAT